MGVDVIVATYGDLPTWEPLAQRAVASAESQTVKPDFIHRIHGESLAEARNAGAAQSEAEWLIFLDADDELNDTYVESMLTGNADLRQPSTLGVYEDGSTDAYSVVIPPKASIRIGNWFIIGTAIRRELFVQAEGFHDEPAWEDWSLMLRCFALRATWETIHNAVYKVGVNTVGRNSTAADNRSLHSNILSKNDRWAFERGLAII